MSEVYTYAYQLTASAGASGKVSAFTVTAGRKMRLREVKVFFPSGSNMYLSLKILRGEEQIVPDGGSLVGDNVVIPVPCDDVIESGQPVIVQYSNSDAANPHTALILFVAEVI